MSIKFITNKALGELAISLCLFGLGLWWAWQAYTFDSNSQDGVGPSAFPLGVGLLMAAGASGCAVRSIRAYFSQKKEAERVYLEGAAATLFVLTIFFGIVFVWFSSVLAILFFLTFMVWRVGRKPLWKSFLSSLIISLSLYLIFDRVLGVQLPDDMFINMVRL